MKDINSEKNIIGLGVAYRLNNFKNRKVLANARSVENLKRMLDYVKKLIMRRDNLYMVN